MTSPKFSIMEKCPIFPNDEKAKIMMEVTSNGVTGTFHEKYGAFVKIADTT